MTISPQRRRDEAVLSATFGTATIIYAARSLGLGSTPIIGFDAEAVHHEFGLGEDEVAVMLLTVGPERTGNWPQKPRLSVADVNNIWQFGRSNCPGLDYAMPPRFLHARVGLVHW